MCSGCGCGQQKPKPKDMTQQPAKPTDSTTKLSTSSADSGKKFSSPGKNG